MTILSQSNSATNSTQGNHLSIKISEQESGETWVSISLTAQLVPPLSPRMTTPRPPKPKTPQEGWETMVGLPTSFPYQAPHKCEEAEKGERACRKHNQLSRTACYEDGCQTHFQDKEAWGWFPQDRSWAAPFPPISRNNKKQQRKHHQSRVTWDKCYKDKYFVDTQEKINAVYYPQGNGERKPLSRWHRRYQEPDQRRKFCALRKRQEREGSEKAQPDVGALQRQVPELLDEKNQFRKNEDKYLLQLADQQTTISVTNTFPSVFR